MVDIPQIKLKSISVKSRKDSKSTINLPILINDSKDSISRVILKEKIIGSWEIETKVNCMICWKQINPKDKVSRCTTCNNKFHVNHWKKWISAKKTCPVCKSKPKM